MLPGLPSQSTAQPAAASLEQEPLPRNLQCQQRPSAPYLPRSDSLRKLDVNSVQVFLGLLQETLGSLDLCQ